MSVGTASLTDAQEEARLKGRVGGQAAGVGYPLG